MRKKYHQFESEYAGIDTRVQVNQVPGGMISNLANQLKEQGALNRMNEVLAEIPRVREDLGFPPLVTPTSQIVGTQAVLNVLTGERYKSITNEVKLYLQGRYGKAPGKINDAVRKMAIGNEEVITCRPADMLKPELDRLREEIGELAKSEEDVLTLCHVPGDRAQVPRRTRRRHPDAGRTQAAQIRSGRAACPPTRRRISMSRCTARPITSASPAPDTRPRNSVPFFVSVDGVPEQILIETLTETVPTEAGMVDTRRASKGSKRPKASKEGHVTSSMPGTIVDILVKAGAKVKAGDPVLVDRGHENGKRSPGAGRGHGQGGERRQGRQRQSRRGPGRN